jgi:DNA topoisomerase-3
MTSPGKSEVGEALSGCEPGSLTLLVAEKPSVARDIARALGRGGKKLTSRPGFLQGERHVVTWAIGHLLELCEPHDYNPSYRRWRLESLPIWPPTFRLKPISRTKDQLRVVSELLRSPAFSVVVNACDAGREGELIFRHLYEEAGSILPVRRLWVSAMTDEAILEGLNALGDGRDYERLEAAARCRSESDWLVGINATRGMTVKCGVLLSVGRVQTPTLAILAEREREIQSFTPETYWEVQASFEAETGSYRGTWFGPGAEDGRLADPARAGAIVLAVSGREGLVEEVNARRRTQPPPLLHDLTQLQRDMNRRYGLSASRTLRLAQDLYEKYKVITYPRTDSRFLSGRNIPLLRATIESVSRVSAALEAAAAPVLGKDKLPISGRLVNDGRIRDHHAIIPTLKAADAARLKGDHLKVFEAVARRFLAAFHPPAVIETTTVVTLAAGERFRSRGRAILEPGWLRAEETGWTGPSEEAEQDLPVLREGLPVRAREVLSLEKETKPPPRYTEASLLQAMDTAGKLVDDEELQEIMKERGIGTPATRAAIIERLIEVGYVERDRRTLSATVKGLELVNLMPTRDLVSPALTGLWEARLRSVEAGELSREEFMAGIRELVERVVREVSALTVEGAARKMRRVVGPCPKCGADVIEGRRAYSCSKGKDACDFYIWKLVAGRELKPAEATTLLAGRKTNLLRGFRSKKGRRFPAYLVLEEGAVRFVFPERKTQASTRAPARKATKETPREAARETASGREPDLEDD